MNERKDLIKNCNSIDSIEKIISIYDNRNELRIKRLISEINEINKSEEYLRMKNYNLLIFKIRLLNQISNIRFL